MKMGGNGLSDREFVEKYDSYKKNDGCFFVIAGLFFLGCVIISFFVAPDWNKIFYCAWVAVAVVLGVCLVRMGIEDWIEQKEQIEKELGMNEKQASRRYVSIIQKPIYGELYPIVQKMCRLNQDAQSSQEEQINGWFKSAYYEERLDVTHDKKFDFNKTYCDADFDRAIQILNREPMAYRQWFVEKLFKLTIVDDGIHNDEWNLLMDIMKQLKFNKNYFDFFIKRYGPLRTEFDDDDPRNASSTQEIPVSQLKAYYAVLGLEEEASDEEIKRAYHKLALQHHPDLPKNAGRVSECEELMARINEAYEKIRN